jgi:DNA repair protein RadC
MTNSAVTKTAVTKNGVTLTKSAAENAGSIAKSRAATSSADTSAKTKARKRKTTRPLKKHFQYIIPQYRLILVKEPGIKPTQITDAIAFQHFIQPLTLYSEEHFIAFHLDSKYQVIGYHEVSKGTLNASLVHPREVFKAALLSNAYAIIVAHNHPSGSVSASPEDIDITKQLIKAGKIMGVCIVDHCIVSSESMNSLRETESHLWGE